MRPKLTRAMLALAFALAPINAHAGSFEAKAGYFKLDAKNSSGEQSLSNFGLYQFTYRLPVAEHAEFDAGYSIYMLGTTNPDLGFGPDLSVRYFPVTRNGSRILDGGAARVSSYEIIRPFVGASFHQRQYQSIQSSFAGVSGSLGMDWAIREHLAATAVVTMMSLKGPLDSRIRELSVSGGLVMDL